MSDRKRSCRLKFGQRIEPVSAGNLMAFALNTPAEPVEKLFFLAILPSFLNFRIAEIHPEPSLTCFSRSALWHAASRRMP